jgi:predicted rRNA methylase YqxC with S4 and FtsJ domains
VLLEAGAARVYAVDAGHGQLLGSLRQDQRVVVLERTNLGELGLGAPPDDQGVAEAVEHAATGLAACGWDVVAATRSPVLGARDAVEWLVHARR